MKDLVIFLLMALVIILITFKPKETKIVFKTEQLQNDFVKTTVIPDGNTWITTKDSVLIYIDNY